MATKLTLYDGEQIRFFKSDSYASTTYGYIQNVSNVLTIKSSETNVISLKSTIELDSNLALQTSAYGSLSIGASNNIINLNVPGVTYNIGTLTGSPAITGNLTISGTGTNTINGNTVFNGNVTINGTSTTINTSTLNVDDTTIELAAISNPTDSTANNGGLILKGTTDKTILWINDGTGWNFNQPILTSLLKIHKNGGNSSIIIGSDNINYSNNGSIIFQKLSSSIWGTNATGFRFLHNGSLNTLTLESENGTASINTILTISQDTSIVNFSVPPTIAGSSILYNNNFRGYSQQINITSDGTNIITLAHSPKSIEYLHLYKNGIILRRNIDYTLTGLTVTLSPGLDYFYITDDIYAEYYY